MPELPEVETTRLGLIAQLENQTVTKVIIRTPKLRWPIPKSISQILPNQVIKSIHRRAKYLLINFDIGTLIVHLGMSGRLQILSQNIKALKHDHVDIIFSNNICLRYTDPRRFGSILWTNKNPLEHRLLAQLGPEPFDQEFNSEYMLEQAKNKKTTVKTFIMNSKIVVGVGNIYASEALFAAKIHPCTPANQLRPSQYEKLIKNLQLILHRAIKNGGTTLKDFLNANGKPGSNANELQVYGRAGSTCLHCKTSVIQSLIIGQRNTFFCPGCQA